MALMRVGEIAAVAGRERFARVRPRVRSSRARVACAPSARAEHWTRHFRCSARDLALAVQAVGNDPLDVGVYLERLCR